MNAVLFLATRQLKNFVRQTVHHPGRLITSLASLGLIAWMFVDLTLHPRTTGSVTDIRVLEGLFLAWLLLLGTLTLTTSLKSGSAVFRMSDVNLLFVSPTSPRLILVYGLARQMGTTLLGFFFMLFYCGSLTNSFPITPTGVLLLVVMTVFYTILVQVVSMLAYGMIRGEPRRRAAVQGGIYAFITLMVLTALVPFVKGGGTVSAAYAAAGYRSLEYFPLVGWAKGAVFALIEGDSRRAALYGALLLASFLLCILLFLKSTPDYYEDVLEKAEKTFALRQAKKEKRGFASASAPKKVGKSGLGRGWGANAFFYKHLCEAHRRSRFVFFSASTVVQLVISLGMYGIMLLIGGGDKHPMPAYVIMAIACGLSVYILFFLNAAGDWSRELSSQYIYLAPEPPFQKLLWASMTSFFKPVFDGIVVFAVTGIAVQASLPTVLICILLYASYGCLFTAGNVLAKRVFGGMANRGIVMVLYMFLLALIAAPGIGGMVFVYMGAHASVPMSMLPFLMGLPVVVWNIFVTGLVFYICRNLLASVEMN